MADNGRSDASRRRTPALSRRHRAAARHGQLAAVHFQFASWLVFHPKNREHIEEGQRRLDGYRLTVEFRNKTWFEGAHSITTLDFERSRGLVNVIQLRGPRAAHCTDANEDVGIPFGCAMRLGCQLSTLTGRSGFQKRTVKDRLKE